MAKQYKITFSGKDLERLEKMSQQLGVSKSEFIRKGLTLIALYAKTQTEKDIKLIIEKGDKQSQITI